MAEFLLTPQLRDHLYNLVPPRPREMREMEAYAQETGFPIVGPVAGHFCYLIARLIGARRVFEMGSGYGYSTAWFARAVQENGGGVVHHTVWSEELSHQARVHLTALGFGDIVQYHVSEAVHTLRQTPGRFDLVFNDIEKDAYPDSLPVIGEKLRSGGVLIADNMLWGGRVLDPSDRLSSTAGVRELTRRVTSDPDWAASIVPLRDGLLVAFKK